MKRFLLIFILLVFLGVLGYFFKDSFWEKSPEVGNITERIIPKPLTKYAIENLGKTEIKGVEIKLEEILEEKENFTSYLFSFSFDPALNGKEKKKVTGLANVPKGEGPFPLIVMFRGYVDQKIYQTGMGTKRAGEYFAGQGFITLAPDFLGYAGSDSEAENIFESRFQTYVTALTLLNSLNSVSAWDTRNVLLWGHSNGGQIAITFLEVSGRAIPTTLWAPVSKPFPYSVLFYTDESEDRGKLIRRELAKFEENYNVDLYAIDLYYDRIRAPLQIHQGTSDDAVPREWSDELTKALEEKDVEFDYFVYPGADHNLNPNWNTVVARDVTFFKKHLD